MARTQPLLRFVDQNGAMSAVQTRSTWNRLFTDLNRLDYWDGVNPCADEAGQDYWELGQMDVTYVFKAIGLYLWHPSVLLDSHYRHWLEAIGDLLADAIGIVWFEVVAVVCWRARV